jgi:hypothetical protein
METQEITYKLNGQSLQANVQLLCPSAWIFVVSCGENDPFHLEYNENRWEAIEEGQDETLVNSIGRELMHVYASRIPRTIVSDERFFIVASEEEEVICFWNEELRIRVAASTDQLRLGDIQEKIYFGSRHNDFKAFQTIDYNGEDISVIEEAIAWYTNRSAGSVQIPKSFPDSALSFN